MIDIKDVPQALLDKIRKRFDAEPKVQMLRVQQQMLQRTGKFAEALSLAKEIDVLFNKCVYEYLKDAENQVQHIDVANLDMPLKDKEDMMQMLLVCFMCADVIETSVKNMNDILHRYDKDMYMEMFNDIRQVMQMSKEKLKYLRENSGYMKDFVWDDNCDNLYDMAKSKAGAIMRKRKDDKNWGKNKEEFSKRYE